MISLKILQFQKVEKNTKENEKSQKVKTPVRAVL